MKAQLKTQLAQSFAALGGVRLLHLLRPARLRQQSLHIFTYHRVNDHDDPFFEATPSKQFREQMAHLARYYTVLPLSAAIAQMQVGTLSGKTIAITFDDGYLDNYEVAFPILREFNLPATIFLTTGLISTGEMAWFDRTAQALRSADPVELSLPLRSRQGESDFRMADLQQRLDTLHRLLAIMKVLPEVRRLAILESLERLPGVSPRQADMMQWEQIREMADAGIEFGAHTVSHPILSRLTIERQREEIVCSKRAIENSLSRPVSGFAYPNGRPEDYNDDSLALLKEAGYQWAVTTSRGANHRDNDPFLLKRGQPWEQDMAAFAIQMWRM